MDFQIIWRLLSATDIVLVLENDLYRTFPLFKSFVRIPEIRSNEFAVFHTYIIQTDKRDELMAYLDKNGIDSKIHYPIPIHYQKAWLNIDSEGISYPKTEKQSKEILSLPIFPELTDEQVEYVINTVRAFFVEKS